MTDIAPIDPQETNSEGLQPLYKAYARQKCFIGYSERAVWRKGLLQACKDVLQEPEFDLEADYAREHYSSGTSLHEKALELIANARCGIYDLSSWEEPAGQWRMPGNVLIELGMAIALNRPAMLLRHSANRQAGLTLPPSLESLEIVEFSGYTTLKAALRAALPKWIREDPEQAWQSRQCHAGGRECEHREGHPRARRLSLDRLCCHVSDGQDVDRDDFRSVVETEIGRFSDVEWSYLDALPPVPGYAFLLCSHCQAVRSNPLALYRITPHTPAETFIAIGMTLGLEKQFGYRIPMMFLVQSEDHLPSLLRGLDCVQAHSDIELKEMLRQYLPEVLRQVRQLPWRRSPLPFVSAPYFVKEDVWAAVEEDFDAPSITLQSTTDLPILCPNCSEPCSSDARFCVYCGYSLQGLVLAALRVVQPDGANWEKPISTDRPLVIGTTAGGGTPGLDLSFYDKDGYLSRNHAHINAADTNYMLTDLGSTNGTKLNGVRLSPHVPELLHNEDFIQVGEVILQFKLESGANRDELVEDRE